MKSRFLLPSVIIIGSLALATIGIILVRGVQKNQQAVPSRAADTWSAKYEDSDTAHFTYLDDPRCWFNPTQGNPSGGTYHQADHSSSGKPYCKPIDQEKAQFNPGNDVKFDQVRVGYAGWSYGAKIDFSVDGTKTTTFDTNLSGVTGANRQAKTWDSPTFTCGAHTISLQKSPGQNGTLTLTLDYIQIHVCSGSGSFLTCQNNACAVSSTATATDPGCLNKNAGDSCSSTSTDTDCQGNTNPSAKCFKCSDRNLPGQVGILDFACFAKYYGQDVGKP